MTKKILQKKVWFISAAIVVILLASICFWSCTHLKTTEAKNKNEVVEVKAPVAVVAQGVAEVKNITIDLEAITTISNTDVYSPSFSPDSSKLVYAKNLSAKDAHGVELYCYDVNTGKQVPLNNSKMVDQFSDLHAWVQEIKWLDNNNVLVRVHDGDVNSSLLQWDIANNKRVSFNETFSLDKIDPTAAFAETEFNSAGLNIAKLCAAIEKDNYAISLKNKPGTIDWLNELLTVPNFYEKWLVKHRNIPLSGIVSYNAKETKYIRNNPWAEIGWQKPKIIKLNRLIIETAYPALTPESEYSKVSKELLWLIQNNPHNKEKKGYNAKFWNEVKDVSMEVFSNLIISRNVFAFDNSNLFLYQFDINGYTEDIYFHDKRNKYSRCTLLINCNGSLRTPVKYNNYIVYAVSDVSYVTPTVYFYNINTKQNLLVSVNFAQNETNCRLEEKYGNSNKLLMILRRDNDNTKLLLLKDNQFYVVNMKNKRVDDMVISGDNRYIAVAFKNGNSQQLAMCDFNVFFKLLDTNTKQ